MVYCHVHRVGTVEYIVGVRSISKFKSVAIPSLWIWGQIIKNCNSRLQNLIYFQGNRLKKSKYCKTKNVKKHVFFLEFIFFLTLLHPLLGSEKNICYTYKYKANFPNFFLRIFKIFKPLKSPFKKLEKFSHIHLLTNYFIWKFQKFWTSPFEGIKFWILVIYGHIIRVKVRGERGRDRAKNVCGKVLHQD